MDEEKGTGVYIPELEAEKNILGKWASYFIEKFRVVYLIILVILIWGTSAYFTMPRELSPEIVLPFGQVLTVYNGAAPEEVEKLITDKIEAKLDGMEKVKNITSSSGFGYSAVFVEFEQGVDMDNMITKMREKVASVQSQLPRDAQTPEVSGFETNNSPILIVNVSGDYDTAILKKHAEDIKIELEKMAEVGDVQIIGGLNREIQIFIDPQRLSTYNISLDQIKNAIMVSNVNLPGGDITLDNRNYNIRTVGELKTAEDLKRVVITYVGATPLYLKDIAQVVDGYSEADSYSRLSSGLQSEDRTMKSVVSISVKKKEWADIIKTSSKIHELIENGKGELYPATLQVEISGDTAVYVEDELGTVFANSKSGLFLVIIVLFLFIGLKESLVVSMVIPLSVFTAFGFMNASGMTFNSITLFSLILAVGMLVDNGIVIMENIDRLRFLGLSSEKAAEVGTNQIAPAIGASTLTTVAAFFPIMLTSGIMGAYIKPIPQTVIFALSASFLVAITITPALCAMALKNHRSNGNGTTRPMIKKISQISSVIFVFVLAMLAFRDETGGIMGFGALSWVFGIICAGGLAWKLYKKSVDGGKSKLIESYGSFIYEIVSSRRKRWMVVGVTLVAFILSMTLIPLGILKVEMFSPTDFTRIYVNVNTPKGTSLEDTNDVCREIEERLLAFSEIKSFVSNVGIIGADSLDDFSNNFGATPNTGRVIIDLYEKEERSRSSMEVAEAMRQALNNIPGADIVVQEVESGPPAGKPIFINVQGESLEDLKLIADDLKEILMQVEGTRDVTNSVEEGMPELQVRVNKEKAALLGLDDMSIAVGIRNAVYGLKATTIKNNQDEIDVVIRTTQDKLTSKMDLEKIHFYSRHGYPVGFSQVAELVEGESVTSIVHEDLKRRVSISADVIAGVTASEVVKKFQDRVGDYSLLAGITISYGGEMEDIQESYTDMFTNMIIAVVLVFLILCVQFNSLSQPLIILFTVPMAMIGVMPGHVITGFNFGFVSFIGIVALVGIAVNNGILLVDYINYLRKQGYALADAVKTTGMTRLKPVITTTITTSGGILPITIKQPFFSPLGYSLIFGLLVSTLLTLIVIPVLYTMLEEWKVNRKNRKTSFFKGGVLVEKVFNFLSLN